MTPEEASSAADAYLESCREPENDDIHLHPMQEVVRVGKVPRFRENKLISILLAEAEKSGFDLNTVALMNARGEVEDHDVMPPDQGPRSSRRSGRRAPALRGRGTTRRDSRMSIKIYYGYRFKKKHLHEFTTTFRDQHYQHVLHHVRELCARMTAPTAWSDKIQKTLNLSCEAAEKSVRVPMLDIECGWKLFFPPNSAYVLAYPYGENPVGGDRIKHPEWLEDYGYWDNTDRPDSVSAREWLRRKKAWKIYTQPRGREPQGRNQQLPPRQPLRRLAEARRAQRHRQARGGGRWVNPTRLNPTSSRRWWTGHVAARPRLRQWSSRRAATRGPVASGSETTRATASWP